MIRVLTSGAVLWALVAAPLQCRRDPEPSLRTEDSAGDALFALAEDFRSRGDEPAAHQTLKYLVERYPSNRHVPAARAELAREAALGATVDAGK